ncbi:pseudouridine synthase [Robiginitalea sp. M366]|uniref:pseudouridine synthase n=1 Tax=Robiginitalea aestuariiviva TaxID=3036903 RepID=UPI00240D8E71|nr:pseudouridine synthase [Robiginitalea aestuariiviva]MDG1571836.1 pseudouridine synthase [Robiginitalea aestuariiviva]
MSRSDKNDKRRPRPRSGGNGAKKASGRQGGNFRRKSYARGNAPVTPKAHTPKPDPDLVRLNRYIANAGVCSRREADTFIAAGNVTVNGKTVTEMGYKVKRSDEVRFDGRLLQQERKEYVLLNKPKNFITTTKDERGRRTVMELISNASNARLLPVGRLDRNTTGLLLFTNDGDLAKKLTHPKHGVRKIYHVELDKSFKASDLQQVREGLTLEDGSIAVDEISYIDGAATKKEVGVQLHSGRNRIVRRIFEHLGYEVVRLDRVVFAGLTKKDLPRGHWRHLTAQELINLKNLS